MKATIKDVARYAGVSVATVSRYLNKSPLIAEASVEKVRGAIEALDYQPSMMARGLLHGNSKTVALAVDYSDSETYGNDYFLRIQYGLEHELSKNGYYLMICHIGGADGALTLRSLINENRIDGLVLLSALAREEVMSIVNESRIPCVIAGRSDDPDAVWVDIDNISAGELAAQRLLETKPAAVGFLANSFDKTFVSERFSGYRHALAAAGIEENRALVSDGLTDAASISAFVRQHFSDLCDAYVVCLTVRSDSISCVSSPGAASAFRKRYRSSVLTTASLRRLQTPR